MAGDNSIVYRTRVPDGWLVYVECSAYAIAVEYIPDATDEWLSTGD